MLAEIKRNSEIPTLCFGPNTITLTERKQRQKPKRLFRSNTSRNPQKWSQFKLLLFNAWKTRQGKFVTFYFLRSIFFYRDGMMPMYPKFRFNVLSSQYGTIKNLVRLFWKRVGWYILPKRIQCLNDTIGDLIPSVSQCIG